MDYRQLAKKMIDLQAKLHQTPIGQGLFRLERGAFFLLGYLAEHGNTAHPKELSREMGVSSARVAALLGHLEEQGLIRRTPDRRDNRQTIVSLTEEGLRQALQEQRKLLELAAGLLGTLGEEDAAALVRIQEKIVLGSLQCPREHA